MTWVSGFRSKMPVSRGEGENVYRLAFCMSAFIAIKLAGLAVVVMIAKGWTP